MQLRRELPIELALFLTDANAAVTVGRALWAALCEVEEFFSGVGRLNVPIGRSEHVVDVLPTFRKAILAPAKLDDLASRPDVEELATPRYESARSKLARVDSLGRVDCQELGTQLRSTLESKDILVVVTDIEIVPPTHLRYLIWDVFIDGALVSTAPISPRYWGEWDTAYGDPVRVMKWRTRAACLAVVGSLLGMTRCYDDRCYLYQTIDAVTRLDGMVHVGKEHGVDRLTGYGFPDFEATPEAIAPVQSSSEPKGMQLR
jgi:hypothetical protein